MASNQSSTHSVSDSNLMLDAERSDSVLVVVFSLILFLLCALLVSSGLGLQNMAFNLSSLSYEQRLLLDDLSVQVHRIEHNENVPVTLRSQNNAYQHMRDISALLLSNQVKMLHEISSRSYAVALFRSGCDHCPEQFVGTLNRIQQHIERFNTALVSFGHVASLRAVYSPPHLQQLNQNVESALLELSHLNKEVKQFSHHHSIALKAVYLLMLVLLFMATLIIWLWKWRPMLQLLKSKHFEIRERDRDFESRADYDVLTGVKNRNAFNKVMHRLAHYELIHNQMALILIDIDNFTAINDSLGHHAGDEVLQVLATCVEAHLSRGETLYRIAGDEFALIIENNKQEDYLHDLVNTLHQAIQRLKISLGRYHVSVNASIGVAWGKHCGATLQEIFSAADIALFHVKQNGRNNIAFYQQLNDQDIGDIIQLEQALHQALVNQEFVVYYQPIVDVTRGTIVALEALARWKHPTRGVLPPGVWLYIAERISLIDEINLQILQVIEQTFRQWKAQGILPIPVNVNMTESLLVSGVALSRVREINSLFGQEACYIGVEITESVILDRSADSIYQQLLQMEGMGVRVALDDFGTGFANLSHLHSIPFSALKLDKNFIQKILDNDNIYKVVKTVIHLADQLNKKVVCEGVESVAVRDALLAMGDVQIQGYFFSKPEPVEVVRQWLQWRTADNDVPVSVLQQNN